jgi:predicted RND superfamily exporter protein
MVVLASAFLVASSGYLITKLVIDNVMVEYFRDDADVVSADRFVRERFGGTKTVSVVVRGKEPLRVLSPDVLTAMDGLSSYLSSSVPEVGKVIAFTDLVKRINQVYNADEDSSGIKKSAASVSDGAGFDGLGDFGDVGDFGFEPDVIDEGTKPPTGCDSPFRRLGSKSRRNDRFVERAEDQALNKKALVEELSRALEFLFVRLLYRGADALKRS